MHLEKFRYEDYNEFVPTEASVHEDTVEYRTWPDYALPARKGSTYYDWLVKIVGFNPHGNPMVNRPPRHVYFPKASTYVKFTPRKMLMKLLVSKQ